MPRKLIFIYNGDSGLFNGLIHYLHKKISPDTYECHLCALIYDGTKQNKAWVEFIKSLGVESEFLHRDTYQKKYGQLPAKLPAVNLYDGKNIVTVLDTAQIDQLKSLEELMIEMKKITKSSINS